MNKPIPVPDSVSEAFWSSAADGRLVVQRCLQCRRFSHPPAMACPRCTSMDLEYEPVSGRGRIYTFTIARDARNPAFAALQPYVIAWVELEEQPDVRMICNLPGEDSDRVAIGASVEVFFEPISGNLRLPQFRLV